MPTKNKLASHNAPARRPVLRERRKQVSYAESDAESDSSRSATFSGSEDSDEDDEEEEDESESESDESSEPDNPLALLAKLKARKRKKNLQLAPSPTKKQRIKRVITPRSIKRLNAVTTITPLKRRAVDPLRPMTNFERARERLHVSAVPDSLPCREEEFAEIYELLRNDIESGTGTCIYISGVPGTGKTATVHEVIRHLQHDAEHEELPPFDFVEINGMKVTDPNQAYSILWECLNRQGTNDRSKRVTSAHALQLLESRFSSKNADERTTVVLMDELDLMVTKKQTVMYNFFEWPNRPDSRLIVVAIANTMDLPERILTNKVSSRMGLKRINFQPYTYEQLAEIVSSRLQDIDAFEQDAINYAARKVSAVSGDARRALDICRRAVEIVEERQDAKTHVTIRVVTEAIQEMLSSPSVAFIQSCSLHQKLFLVSVLHCIRRSGLGDVEFGDVVLAHTQTCKWHHIEAPTTSDLMRVCESLGQARALVIEHGRMDLSMRMSLNLLEEDIIVACKNDRIVGRWLANVT